MAKARSGDAKFTFTNPGLVGLTAQQAVYKVGMEILRDAVKSCPVDTGTLARSITYKRGRDASTKLAAGDVGTDVFYAPFVEFGTSRAAAQPFLGPALERARMKYGR